MCSESLALALAALACLVGCGQPLISDPGLSPSPSNAFACTTCHATAPPTPATSRIFPGAALVGVTQRPSYWSGGYTYLLDAVNQCLTDFMRGEDLAPTDPKGLALLAYLDTLAAPGAHPALPCTIVRNIDATYLASLPKGDPAAGQAVWQQACASCHGATHSGSGRLSSYVSIVPEDTQRVFPAAQVPAVIAEKVRHGKYFGIAGNMSPFCTEVLSDGQLSDLLAYILM